MLPWACRRCWPSTGATRQQSERCAPAQEAERAKAAMVARSQAPKQFAQRCEDLRLSGCARGASLPLRPGRGRRCSHAVTRSARCQAQGHRDGRAAHHAGQHSGQRGDARRAVVRRGQLARGVPGAVGRRAAHARCDTNLWRVRCRTPRAKLGVCFSAGTPYAEAYRGPLTPSSRPLCCPAAARRPRAKRQRRRAAAAAARRTRGRGA